MARQFLIGEEGGTTNVGTGVLADTQLDVQALGGNPNVPASNSETGPYSWAPGDPQPELIRIVQGTTAGVNVYSNWFNPRNVIVYDGNSYTAATAATATLTFTGNSVTTAGQDGLLHIKLTKKGGPVQEFFTFEVDFNAGGGGVTTADSAADALVGTAWDAIADDKKPDWIHPDVNITAGTTVVWSGRVPGDTTNSGGTWDEDASQIEVSIVGRGDIATCVYSTSSTGGLNGVGTYYSVKSLEDKMKGIMYGYYNRLELPNSPDNGAVVGGTYDLVGIVATKDGSSASGQIHGVDNLDELTIALRSGVATLSGAANTSFVEKLNAVISLGNIAV